MQLIVDILIAYIVAAPLTSLISFDLRLTEWTNIWTYIYWGLGRAIWFLIIFIGIATIATLIKLFQRR